MHKRPANHSFELTRRSLLRTGAAAAGALLAPASFARAEPKKGGHLVLAVDGASAANSLDPATYDATYPEVVGFQWGNALVELDEHAQATSELAESWEADKTGKSWVIKLRQDVEFHNGKSFTAEDVVYSLNHHRGAESKSVAKSLLKDIEDLRVSAPGEVTITLTTANMDLPFTLADYHLLMFPEGGDAAAGIGTGPYIIDSFEPGVRTRTHRNPNYWKEGRSHADTVETVAMNDLTARTSALLSGSVHYINRINPKLLHMIEGRNGLQVWNVPGSGHYTFQMMTDVAPYNNNDFRLALKYAIDRRAILDIVLNGFGAVGNDVPIPSFDRYFAADLPQRSYDPDKVQYHLKKAAVDIPATLNIAEIAFSGAVDAAQMFQQQAAKAGLTLNVNRVPNDGYWSNVWAKEPFSGSYSAGRPTPDLMLTSAYHSEAAWNDTHWRNEKFDNLLVAARGERDEARRRQMYHDLQFMIYEEGGTILPVFNNYIFAGSGLVDGFRMSPIFAGMRVAEQLYFV
ncbi:MAG: ABC transporter substrate-binding protein [Gemmobacter sp.]|jgi:peptide/nickel transport system substrate-binding protein|nr:ABC transporter substrate-binding protein [Gemmobacter sp.]